MKVQDLIDRYMAHARVYYRKPKSRRVTSEVALMRLSCRPLRAVARDMPVEDVTAATLAECRRWLLEHCPRACRRTINGYTSRMVRVFTWGADPEQGLVPELVGARLKMLRPLPFGRCAARESDGLEAVDRDKINDLLASLLVPRKSGYKMTPKIKLARLRLATMIELQMEVGMRPGELCTMSLEQIDTARDIWVYRPFEHKTEHHKKLRMVPLFDNEQFLIRRWCEIAGITSGRLFEVTVGSYRQSVQRALKRAGLERWTPQQLRHTAGTEVRKQAGLDTAQALLGHSSSRTTEIYAENKLDEAIEQLKRHRYGS